MSPSAETFNRDGIVEHYFIAVEGFDERCDATFKIIMCFILGSLIDQMKREAGDEIRAVPDLFFDDIKVRAMPSLNISVSGRMKYDRAGVIGFTRGVDWTSWDTPFVFLRVDFAVRAMHLDF